MFERDEIENTRKAPRDSIPIDLEEQGRTRNAKPVQEGKTTKKKSEPTTLRRKLEMSAPWERKLLKNIEIKKQEDLEKALKEGNVWVASDGGLDKHGYFGWMIANDTEILAEGSGSAPSEKAFNSSMRAESFGMLAAARFVLHTANFKRQHINRVLVWSDSESLIKRINSMTREINP